jgi:hypothetical protein
LQNGIFGCLVNLHAYLYLEGFALERLEQGGGSYLFEGEHFLPELHLLKGVDDSDLQLLVAEGNNGNVEVLKLKLPRFFG